MNIPSKIPAMTLKGIVLFPNAIMPLRIFENRYKLMLADVLKSDRMFAIAAERDRQESDDSLAEPPFEVATAGLVRVSKTNSDGTSLVMLQGLSRLRIESIDSEDPYRVLNVHPFETLVDKNKPILRSEIIDALSQNCKLGGEVTQDILDYVKELKDDATFIDVVAYTLCQQTIRKQAMLEVQRLHKRAEMLLHDILQENLQLSIQVGDSDNSKSYDAERN